MARLALALALLLSALAPSWAAKTVVARVPVLTAPTAPQQARLDEILSAAKNSPTAVAVLDRAARLRTEAIPVMFKKTGTDHGYFDYELGGVALSKRYQKGEAARAVPTLIHEILHVAQDDARTPAMALERELEAHALTIRILDELGLQDEGSFSVGARARLTSGATDFKDWMRLQHHLSYEYRPRARAEIASEIEYDLDEAETRAATLSEALKKAPGSRRLRKLYADANSKVFGLRTQLEALSPAGWRRYKRWAAKVAAVLQSEHERLRGFAAQSNP